MKKTHASIWFTLNLGNITWGRGGYEKRESDISDDQVITQTLDTIDVEGCRDELHKMLNVSIDRILKKQSILSD